MNPDGLVEVFSAALPALQQSVELAGDASAGDEDRLTAANAFSESLAELWPAAEAAGPHLTELLAFLDGAASALPQASGDNGTAGVLILEVLALLQAHLAEPGDPEIVAALVEMAGSDAFEMPLSPEAAALWLASGQAGAGEEAVGAGSQASDELELATLMAQASAARAPSGPPSGPTDAGASDDLEPAAPVAQASAAPVATAPAQPPGEAGPVADAVAGGGLGQGVERAEPAAPPPQPPARKASAGPKPAAGPTSAAAPTAEAPALSADAAELLAILATAVEDNRQDLLRRIAEIDEAASAGHRAAAVEAAREILERFAEASAEAGFAAFSTVCSGLAQRMGAKPTKRRWPASLLEELAGLPRHMLDYLEAPLAAPARRALVRALSHRGWPEPMSAADAGALAADLYRDPLAIEHEVGPERAQTVEDEDLSLAPAEDMDGAILASFRREGPDMAGRLATLMETLCNGAATEDNLRLAQRLAHTLKGSANVCGIRAIAVLSHHLEDLLEFLTEQGLAPSAALGDTLLAAADGLAALFDVIEGREAADPQGLRAIVQQVLDWANLIDREGAAALAHDAQVPAPRARAGEPAAAPTTAPAPTAAAAPAPTQIPVPVQATAETEPEEADDAYLQVPARSIDDLLRLVGELSIALSQSEEQLSQAERTLREAGERDRLNQLRIVELEKLVDLRGVGTRMSAGKDADGDADAFDPLELEQYSELYVATRQLGEGVSDARELSQTLDGTIRSLAELTQQQIALGREIRQLTVGTRLVPAGSIAARLQRTVRQTCRATGKEAELELKGTEVQVDGDVLDRLMPALMHAVRNAIDHGIEPPEQRVAAGKPRSGHLTIAFRQSGDRIEVSVGDDGCGLDLARVRAKAIAGGLLSADADPSPQELALLTLRPGFSTRERATQVSGRGVGMDVVASTVRALHGTLAIDSRPGQGYRLDARLPGSLLTVYCLLVQCQERLIALPANEVRLAVLADEGEIVEGPQGPRFIHREGTCPLLSLNAILGLPSRAPERSAARSAERRGVGVVLLVASELGERAVLVDDLIDGRELVVKKLGSLVPRVPGLVASSILGDGRVVPILGLGAVMRFAASAEMPALAVEEEAQAQRPPTVLVVDDSLSMRRTLAQLVSDSGYRAITARDGMDALQAMAREPVDCLLVDLEMPQMNGLELTGHLRAQSATDRLPIGMITSRSTERHRREALRVGVDRYFVKPYREEDVLDFLQEALGQAP